MQVKTIQALSRLTQNFYTQVGHAFSKTRQSAWPGWNKLSEIILKTVDLTKRISVIDVGCGNGRFATFIYKSITKEFSYLGIDSSTLLLSQAKVATTKFGITTKIIAGDVINALLDETVDTLFSGCTGDLIVSFGVLHHIPSKKLRTTYLQALTNQLNPAGLLVVSLWQFEQFKRYHSKFIDPQKYQIDPTELETGDYLLGWDRAPVVRYCHSFSEEEIKEIMHLCNALDLELINRYTADGKEGSANTYLVFQKN